MQVWFKNRRAKCRQIQKAGEQQQQQQQQQVVNSVVKNASSCAAQLANGSSVGAVQEPSIKQRSASACSSSDSRGDSPVPVSIKFNCASTVAAAAIGNSCSRSPVDQLERASGDGGSAPSMSPPGPASWYNQLPASPPSPSSGVLLPSARPSCLAASSMWRAPIPHDVISCNGVGYRDAGNVGSARGAVAGYGSMVMSPNSNGFYSNHGAGYGYGDMGGPGASYGYYGNGAGSVEQWQWTTSMTRSYGAPPEHAMLGCGPPPTGQTGSVRYGGIDVGSYLPQSHVRQLAELSDGDFEDRKDWHRFHAL